MNWLQALAPYVPLLQTMAWVLLIAIGAALFRNQWRTILDAIRARIERGSSLKAGPIELGEDLRDLEYVKPAGSGQLDSPPLPVPSVSTATSWAERRDKIYHDSRGVFLAHVIEPSREPGQIYDLFVYLIRHKSAQFDDIDYAEFFFGHYWGNTVFRESPGDGLIGVATSAYGPFLCTCRVTFKDGYAVDLYRYIDFEMGRVFDQPPNKRLQPSAPAGIKRRRG